MSVPEPEKGREDGQDQDEEAPEPVLLIRLDEADALVHLKSMVSYRLSPHSISLSPSLFHFPTSDTGSSGGGNLFFDATRVEFLELMGVVLLIV